MMASSREHSEHDIVRLPPDEERSIVHQALTDHYRNTLDRRMDDCATFWRAARHGLDYADPGATYYEDRYRRPRHTATPKALCPVR